jgi:3-oxoacyl-[acyl-carrier protein] reductase
MESFSSCWSGEMSDAHVALVAGGTGGVGQEICAALAAQGMSVAVGYRSRSQEAESLAARLAEQGASTSVVRLDLADPDSVTRAVEETVGRFGRLDIAVYAAGPYIPQLWLGEITSAQLTQMLSDDVGGCFNLATAALPALRDARGTFLALSTPAVARHIKKDSLSSIPKAAVEAIVRAIASEEARFGVRANAVSVGFIEAGMFFEMRERGDFSDAYVEAATKNIPLGYRGTGADIAGAVAYLASDAGRYVTGQTLVVDGGLST